ncbi:DUF2958 domain-containing protein [Sphingomonas sp. JC676]|uniref:DUF2958 domain-containing protein n=1 Tax=Sphingomonas sp. JC676 TaxID=2768065 RepID=UPI001657F812|nr:DUF2958 domain-containing protein [Sphingomonas sp. JC676]MBC9030769.1 DUF2958 domain-containing protein [Sphingomonas sp. JC676]
MTLLPDALRAALLTNGAEPPDDPAPLLKLFNPLGPATWLATALGSDGDTLFEAASTDVPGMRSDGGGDAEAPQVESQIETVAERLAA